jgi:ankyrin repeat protein
MMVELLLAKDGVDLNLKNNKGQTPLLLAAKNIYETAVKLLFAKNNIDLNLKNYKITSNINRMIFITAKGFG